MSKDDTFTTTRERKRDSKKHTSEIHKFQICLE